MNAWTSADESLLLELLDLDTVTPMESGRCSALADAQRLFAEHGCAAGLEVAHFAAPDAHVLQQPEIPLGVRERAAEMGEQFLASQPNLVLRLGPPRPWERTIVFNAHLDTVGGRCGSTIANGIVFGRGAIDAKGPAVAGLAGVRAAAGERGITERVTVLLHAVGGEEGGAMGVYGTRELVRRGYVGRLNVFAEPTSLGFLDHGTSTMTARIAVRGIGSTDDAPESGDNATLILGFLACRLAERVGPAAQAAGAKLCIGGIHTGHHHNRVYGTGQLLVNLAYRTPTDAERLGRLVEEVVGGADEQFARRLGDLEIARRSSTRVRDICELTWVKRGLPVLANRDPEMEALLGDLGLRRHDDGDGDCAPFACDAMWLQRQGCYTVVFGPGDLVKNGAHTEREHAGLRDLAAYSVKVAELIKRFAARVR